MKRFKFIALAAALALPIAACDEGDTGVVAITGSVSGTVTVDGSGLSGVTVSLSGTQSGSTTTGANGSYQFSDLPAGSYVVTLSGGVPSDVSFAQTSQATTIAEGSTSRTVNFSGMQIATSSIVGSVRAGGNGIANVSVSANGDGSGSATTDADGQYAITGLPAGSYTVSISGFDANDFEFSTTQQQTSVSVGGTSVVNFSGDEAETATITATVTVDGNGRAGVTVNIAGPASRSATTGSSGQAVFNDLPRGTYAVAITNPDPANISFESTNGTVTISDIGGSGSASFVGSTIEQGEISGRVFRDMNRNGSFDTGDTGFDGMTVTASGPVTRTATTASDGTYTIGMLPGGTYTVSITNPNTDLYVFDATSLTRTITAQGSANANFRATERRDGSISGRVWFDNGDGVFTSVDEAAVGFTMSLSGTESKTTTTGSDGAYAFNNLLLGDYDLSCDGCAAGFMPTSPVSISLTSAATSATQNFMASGGDNTISGRLYIDGNENGVFDAGVDATLPIAGVVITLEGPQVGQLRSTTTDANGEYAFNDLADGDFNISYSAADAAFTGENVTPGGATSVALTGVTSDRSQNFPQFISVFTVEVPVVYGPDNGNEVLTGGDAVTLFFDQGLTSVAGGPTTVPASGVASFTFTRATLLSNATADPEDFVLFSQVTGPQPLTGNHTGAANVPTNPAVAGVSGVNEFTIDRNKRTLRIEDHNRFWTQVTVTGRFMEQDGDPVSDAIVGDARVVLGGQLGFGTAADLSDRAVIATDPVNDDAATTGGGAVARTEATGEYSFVLSFPRPAGTVAPATQIWSVQGSLGGTTAAGDQLAFSGNNGAFASVTVDGSMPVVTMPNITVRYPNPDVFGRAWHEFNGTAGFQTGLAAPAVNDNLLDLDNLGTLSILWDDDADGVLENHTVCGVGAVDGVAACTVVASGTVDMVDAPQVILRLQTADPLLRFIPDGLALESSTTITDPAGAVTEQIDVDVTSLVNDVNFSTQLGAEPFAYKFEGNIVRFHVWNETGPGVDADGLSDGSETAVFGVQISLNGSGLGMQRSTVALPRTGETAANATNPFRGTTVASNLMEGEYTLSVTGVNPAVFTPGVNALRFVVHGGAGATVSGFLDPTSLSSTFTLRRTTADTPFDMAREQEAQFRGGAISGFFFDNDDDDDDIDPNEVVVGHVVDAFAEVADGTTMTVTSSASDATGKWNIIDLWEGRYSLTPVVPSGVSPNPTARGNKLTTAARNRPYMIAETGSTGGVGLTSGAAAIPAFPGTAVDQTTKLVPDGGDPTPGGTDFTADVALMREADTDFELAFSNTEVRLTVVVDATGAPIAGATVDVNRCTPSSTEGTGVGAPGGGVCAGPVLFGSFQTNSAGQVILTGLQEGFWQFRVDDSSVSAGAAAVVDDWTVRTKSSGDIEARTARITP